MKKKAHLLVEILCFIPLWLIFDSIRLSLLPYPIMIGALFPDLDQIDKITHRNIVFHTILIPFGILLFNLLIEGMEIFSVFAAMCVLAVGIHILCDIHLRKKKMTGTYTLKYFVIPKWITKIFGIEKRVYGFSGITSTIIYLINVILSAIIFIIVV